jgi:putative CocE/NonD family hydrolase
LFDWYLQLGSLKNVNEKYFKGKIPTWNSFVQHPNYDAYWRTNSPLNYMPPPQIPMLHVGGYYDQEDINGPQQMYEFLERNDRKKMNYIVLGPWNHGQWARMRADSLGKISFESNTAEWFQALQKKWFDHWLKGVGENNFNEAYCFQTGNNKWKTYSTWPPKEAAIKKLYVTGKNSCSFAAPTATKGINFVYSDPAKPVPYRTFPLKQHMARKPLEAMQVEDQRLFIPDQMCEFQQRFAYFGYDSNRRNYCASFCEYNRLGC